MDMDKIFAQLSRDSHGIYLAEAQMDVSYSEDGHAQCFQVEDESFWFAHRNACIGHVIRNHPYQGILLDVGGGNGFVSAMLQAQGLEVALLEPGYQGALNARTKRGIRNVLCATIEDCNFPSGSLGAIGLFDVIEHIDDDEAFLQQIISILKPAGMIYLTVPCHGWLWSRSDADAGHFRRHTIRTVRRLLEPHFDIEYVSYFFAPLVLPQFAFRALPYRLGLQQGPQIEQARRMHGTSKGLATRLVTSLLHGEEAKIANDQSLRFGASCLAAARLH